MGVSAPTPVSPDTQGTPDLRVALTYGTPGNSRACRTSPVPSGGPPSPPVGGVRRVTTPPGPPRPDPLYVRSCVSRDSQPDSSDPTWGPSPLCPTRTQHLSRRTSGSPRHRGPPYGFRPLQVTEHSTSPRPLVLSLKSLFLFVVLPHSASLVLRLTLSVLNRSLPRTHLRPGPSQSGSHASTGPALPPPRP